MKKTVLLVALGATVALASCSNDEVIDVQSHQGLPIDFRVTMGLNSRGTEVNSANLKGIKVGAFYGDIEYFNDALFQVLTDVSPTDGHYTFTDRDAVYYWPAEGDLTFYAYGKRINEEDILVSDNTMSIASNGITSTYTVESTIENQKDLVAAYAKGSKKNYEADGVPLDFHHLLSQIQIDAKCNSRDYEVYVKEVKICQIQGTGNLTFTGDGTKTGNIFNTNTQWTGSNKQSYSEKVKSDNSPITLGSESINLNQNTTKGNFMLIPQQLSAWDPEIEPNNNGKGAYIALNVRIISKGDTRVVYYPYNSSEYAWTAVPIGDEWTPGKKYIYTLDFTNGAGYIDPDDEEIPGKPTLNKKIDCTVSVLNWDTKDKRPSLSDY